MDCGVAYLVGSSEERCLSSDDAAQSIRGVGVGVVLRRSQSDGYLR